MPKIVVINNATEQMLGQNLNAQQASFAAKAALRNVWLARPGDVVVSAASPSAEFRNYVAEVTSYAEELGEPHYISVDTGVGPAVLQDQHLLQAPLIDQLRSYVACAEEWSVLACYQTAGVARLQSALGLARAGGARINRLFAEHRGTDLLNRKSHFRQLAIGCGLPLAEGTLVASGPDLRRAVCDLIHLTGKVIVKQDNGAGGTGNCILSDTATGPLPGAYASLELPRQEGDRDREIIRLWDRWQSTSNGPMVVEA